MVSQWPSGGTQAVRSRSHSGLCHPISILWHSKLLAVRSRFSLFCSGILSALFIGRNIQISPSLQQSGAVCPKPGANFPSPVAVMSSDIMEPVKGGWFPSCPSRPWEQSTGKSGMIPELVFQLDPAAVTVGMGISEGVSPRLWHPAWVD